MKKILILEDFPMHQQRYSSLLKDEDCEVTIKSNGFLGLVALLNEKSFDGVITDEHMPKMNGTQFIHAIKNRYSKHFSNLPVLIHTMSSLEIEESRVRDYSRVYSHKKTKDTTYIKDFLQVI